MYTMHSASAGAGKTTLVCEWAESLAGRAVPLAWVSLAEGDNDPVRFWRYACAALERLHVGVSELTRALLEAPVLPAMDSLLTTLINTLSTRPRISSLSWTTITSSSNPDGRVGTVMKGGRWIAFSGCAYVVAWIIGLVIGLATSSPGPSDSISTIGAYFSFHREVAMIQAYFLDGIAGASLIVFAAVLRSTLRRFEGESATVSSILFEAGVAAGTVSLLQGLFTQVLADRVVAMGNAAAIRTLFDLNGESDTYKLLALGVFLGALALLAFRTHALPRWIGWVAAVLAPLLVIAGWNFALSPSANTPHTLYS